jgi:ribonucleoside-triphosphate reductase (thioredoxin)
MTTQIKRTNDINDSTTLKRQRRGNSKYLEQALYDELNQTPFNTMGLFTYLRTYARRHDESDPNSTIESWDECVSRVVKSCNSQLQVGFTIEEQREVFSLLYNLKCSVAGRFMWQLGTKTVEKSGLLSLQNCAFTKIDNTDAVRPFTWAMNSLMCGVGVGFSLRPEDVASLPKPKYALISRKDTHDADFIVPDSREGWVKLLGKTLKAHFYSGKSFTYSCTLLRSKGAPIKSFGGTASGPDTLCDGIQKISNVLNARADKEMRAVDALDIMNIIGMIVVSGNVRRSALVAIGEARDKEYLRAKRWDLGNIPNWRAFSNNSVYCDDINEILENEEFWLGYNGTGEPYGLINMGLSRKCGRLGEYQYPDSEAEGYNPCCEQTISNYESCCLGEIYLPNLSSVDELRKCVTYIYRICKHSLTLKCPDSPETEKIVHKNMRMGIGITGYLQATEEQKSWLSDTYKYLREFDVNYSRMHGFPISIKLTTCKPSGTLSILGNCTPGIHPGFSQYYIRRIRICSDSPLVTLAKENGYPVEFVKNFDGSFDHTTQIISFPIALPEGTVLAKHCSAIDQLEYVKRLQTEWSDNSVSVTVYYKKEELPDIKEWLRKNYNNGVKTVSFLLHNEHGFAQAPMEEITKEEYLKLESQCKKITSIEGICYHSEKEENLGMECASGACPIR